MKRNTYIVISDSEEIDEDVIVKPVEQFDDSQIEEEKIEIRPPDYPVRIKGVQGFSGDILQKHFCTLLVGRPDSGKSHLIYEFLTNPQMYNQKFNRVIFVTQNKSIGGINLTQCPYWIQTLDVGRLDKELKKFDQEVSDRYPTDKDFSDRYGNEIDPLNVLIILDDVVAEIRRNQFHPFVKSLFYNRRHLINRGCVSLLVTTQYYVDLPRSFRSNLTSLIVFNTNKIDWDRMKQECMQQIGALPPTTEQQIANIFKTPKAFLYLNIEQSLLYHRFNEQLETDNEQINKKIKLN